MTYKSIPTFMDPSSILPYYRGERQLAWPQLCPQILKSLLISPAIRETQWGQK